MKKAFLLASALMLLGGSIVFANDGNKDKNKGKKPAGTEQTCTKDCSKHCPPVGCSKGKCCKG